VSSELWATDDYGDSWQALGTITMSAFDIPPDPDGFFVVSSLSVHQVVMVDDTVVALASVDVELDLQAVAESHGYTANPNHEWSLSTSDSSDTVTVTFCSVGLLPSDDETCSGDQQQVSFTSPWYAEDFGLSCCRWELLVSTDGAPFEGVAGLEGQPLLGDRLMVRQGRFHLLGGAGFFVSDDGATWTAAGIPTRVTDVAAFGQGGLAGTSDDGTDSLTYSTDGGTTWATEPIPVQVYQAAGGPGGLAMVGTPPAYNSAPAAIVRFFQDLAGVDHVPPWHIGWSPDGTTWSWQPATEVSAITSPGEFPAATVGRDRILVQLSVGGSDERWYVADLPGRDG
jgi:hypothetical protein